MIPKGKLIPIGGAEKRHSESIMPEQLHSEANRLTVLTRVVNEIKGEKSKIEVITSASSIPELVGNEYLHSFRNLGCEYVGVLNLRTKKEVLQKESLRRLENADALMISGGNQIRLSRSYLGTPFYDLLDRKSVV